MRVLLVTGSFPPMTCGVGDYTRSLAESLARLPGAQVAVLTSIEAAAQGGAGVEMFPVVRDWTRRDLPSIERVLATWRPEVVHLQYPTQGYRDSLAWQLPWRLHRRGLPVVQTWHEYVPRNPGIAVPHMWLALAPGDVVVVRPEFSTRLPLWYRPLALRKRFHLIPNAPTLPRVELSPAERASLRAQYAPGGKALLLFFGFLYEHKGIDDLLEAMEPRRHHLVLVGDPQAADPYQRRLLLRLGELPLREHVTLHGFLPALEAARLLAAADAVVLPFRRGGGSWNTSLKAAALQGTFVLTTSTERHGWVPGHNAYYARPGDVADLRRGLDAHLGHRVADPSPEVAGPTWEEIARRHLALYATQG